MICEVIFHGLWWSGSGEKIVMNIIKDRDEHLYIDILVYVPLDYGDL